MDYFRVERNFEREAEVGYQAIATQAMVELSVMPDKWISREMAKRLRDEYKIKSDKERRFKRSTFGRHFSYIFNRPIYRKYWYEAFDMILAHMNITGRDCINSTQLAETIFDKEIYKKYFRPSFLEFAVKEYSNEKYFSEMTKDEKREYYIKSERDAEQRLPKYGMLETLEEESMSD